MSEKQNKKPPKIKTNTKKKVVITLAIILLFFVGIGFSVFGYGYSLLGKMDKIEVDESSLGINEETEEKLSTYDQIENIVLFGVDATDGGAGRSDSIMIATIDKGRNKLKLSSIMRDSYVNIPGHGMDKINHAYAFGKAELAIRTINENFDLNIKDFATVDFSSLPKIIDKLGGLDLNITNEELKYINSYINELNNLNGTNAANITKAGIQHVNGTQAMAYSRIRYTSGGDYERTQRHRNVLTALFDKFKSTSPTKYPNLLNELLPMVKTSLSSNEILALATDVVKMGNSKLEQDRFPRDGSCEGKTINGIYYLTFNETDTIKQMHDYIFNDVK